MVRWSGERQMNVSGMSGEQQVNLNLSLTLVDVKLVYMLILLTSFSLVALCAAGDRS